MTITIDTAKLPTLLTALRLPAIARLWPDFCARADKESWPAARLLAALAELELAEGEQRRIQRHLAEARLPPRPRPSTPATSPSFHRSARPGSWPSQRATHC